MIQTVQRLKVDSIPIFFLVEFVDRKQKKWKKKEFAEFSGILNFQLTIKGRLQAVENTFRIITE